MFDHRFDHLHDHNLINYRGVAQLIARRIWDAEAASLSLATRTIKAPTAISQMRSYGFKSHRTHQIAFLAEWFTRLTDNQFFFLVPCFMAGSNNGSSKDFDSFGGSPILSPAANHKNFKKFN